jgi:hypothetical protein
MTWTIDQAANLVSIHANETLTVPNSHINFNNTETINVVVYPSTSNVNTANVEFSVNSATLDVIYNQSNLAYTQANTALNQANLAIGIPASSISSNGANIQYTDTYFTDPFFIPAGTLQPGSAFRISTFGGPLTLSGANLNIRMGSGGNTTDTSIYSIAPVGTGITAEFIVVVRDNTNTAPVITVPMTPIAINNNGPQFQPNSYATIDATSNNYLGMSFHNSPPSQGPNYFIMAIVEQIK